MKTELNDDEFLEMKTEVNENPLMIHKRHIDINEEPTIREKVNTLKRNYDKYINDLKLFDLDIDFNIRNVLENYKDKVFDRVFSKDEQGKTERETALDDELWVREYIIKKGLRRNERIEKSYDDLKKSFESLELNILDGDDFVLDITYTTFNNTNFMNFFEKDVDNFIGLIEKYYGNFYRDEIKGRLYSRFNWTYDMVNKKKESRFDSICCQKRDERDTDYYNIVKIEQYKIK